MLNLAFYRFMSLVSRPGEGVSSLDGISAYLEGVCHRLNLKGTIILSQEGVNASIAGEEVLVREFQKGLEEHLGWKDLNYKESLSNQVPFQNMFIKIKKELIPSGDPKIQPATVTAPRLSPQELKSWLDSGKELCLLDTRNKYEVEMGTFDRATHFEIGHFRDFFQKKEELNQIDRTKPLVMFCTGGIRCEKASVLALREGFEQVYQLDGGLLKYFEECGGAHFNGHCFVFDERKAVDFQLNPLVNH